ncbi:MAG: hypothetical protein ACR2OZ_21105 [Verrucomicrobiales bacterium]
MKKKVFGAEQKQAAAAERGGTIREADGLTNNAQRSVVNLEWKEGSGRGGFERILIIPYAPLGPIPNVRTAGVLKFQFEVLRLRILYGCWEPRLQKTNTAMNKIITALMLALGLLAGPVATADTSKATKYTVTMTGVT